MRITFVVPALETTGGARIAAGHASQLAQRGHHVTIVVPAQAKLSLKQRAKVWLGRAGRPSRPEESHYGRAGVPIHVIGHEGPPLVDDFPDADVIIATFWITAEWVWALPRSKGAKIHFLQHYEVFPGLPADRVDAVWRLPMPKVAVSKWLVDLGRERFGIDDIMLALNSVDHHLFKLRPGGKSTIPTVGFLYSGTPFKDIETSIAAIKQLRRHFPHLQVVSFGGAQPGRGELPPGTEFTYLPSQDKIAEIYSRCDVWMSTSEVEGFNLPPLEAMATGCPAVCSKTGRPLEIIEDGVNGYLVDQGDAAGFSAAIAAILNLPADDWMMMSRAAAQAVAHPTWEESSAAFESALNRAVRDQPRA